MSILKAIATGVKLVKKVVSKVKAAKGVKGATGAVAAAGVGGGLVKVLPRVGGAVVRQLPGVGAGIATGVLFDQFGNQVTKKRRRMNPCNGKALTRALRRVESFSKVQKRVEKAMRKSCPPARRRATPSRCK